MGQYISNKSKLKWYDPYTGTIWEATENEVKEAEARFNTIYELKGYCSLNTLRYYLNLPLAEDSLNYIWYYLPLEEQPFISFKHIKYIEEDINGVHDTGMWIMQPNKQPQYRKIY